MLLKNESQTEIFKTLIKALKINGMIFHVNV